MSRLLSFLLLATLSFPLGAQTATLVLTGEDGRSRTLTMADLSALEQHEVTSVERDSSRVTYRGPTVQSLMNLVGAPTGRGLRGPAMLLAVLAEASDGYKVAFMLSELDEQFGNRAAIVALRQDGKSVDAEYGPFRVAVPGETSHRARWIRQLTALRLVRVPGPGGPS
jgi:hypothetical protein